MSKPQLALVLVDVIAHGLKAGQLLEADAVLIKQLEGAGEVDPHRDAVAYAKSQQAPVVRSAIAVATEKAEAAKSALLVEIAQLEDLAAKAEGDSKAALEQRVAQARARLAAI